MSPESRWARSTSRVLVESPTYPNAIATLEGAGATLVTYPLEFGPQGHHWNIDAMDQLMGQMRPRSAYLIPDFHNPTGALLPEDRRRDLAEALRRHRVVPVFDESLVELGLEGDAVPTPMSALIPDSVTVGSVSKVYWGGMRIGWMRIPRHRVDHFASSRLGLDLGAPVLEQLVTVELMENHDAIVADCRSRLRAARDKLAAQVRSWLPEWKLIVPAGGMALWAELPEARSGVLSIAARNHGLRLVAGPNFAPAGGLDRWIRLPYTVPDAELDQVGPRLAAAWNDAKSMAGRGTDRPGPHRRVSIMRVQGTAAEYDDTYGQTTADSVMTNSTRRRRQSRSSAPTSPRWNAGSPRPPNAPVGTAPRSNCCP